MILESLNVHQFRNYESLSIHFHPKLNIFLGNNAQGKTNLLEAIYVLALAKSHRTSKDRELMMFDKDESFINGSVKTSQFTFPLSISISKAGKRAKVNHLEVAKLSDFIGHLNIVLFAPEDLNIVKGSPQIRRKFLNVECGQISKVYLNALSQYQKLLIQKNHYLKQRKVDLMMLDVLNNQLAEYASVVMLKRQSFIQVIEKYAADIHRDISNQQETLTIDYNSNIKIDTTDESALAASIKEVFDSQTEKEIERMQTLVGPHRDDIAFFINGKNVGTYGSQGQQRTTALSIKLAEIELIHDEIGEYPILLLDDVLSELDQSRQTMLLTTIRDRVQTFVTTPSISDIKHDILTDMKTFTILSGTVKDEG